MAPILIDTRGLLKLGLISLLTVLAVFSAGYFSGYQKATVFYTTANEIEALDLPEQGIKDSSDVNAQLPEMTAPGEEIDVDQPVEIKSGIAQDNNSYTEGLVIAPAENTTTEMPAKMARVSSDDTAQLNKEVIEISDLTADELDEIKYSAQVGVYGNLVNAENMVKMLQAKNFNAYVADYTNKKNETRYNVRFGYFFDKKTAISALRQYKESEKGDGYLVNFSVDNIVKLANKDIVKPVVPAEIKDKVGSFDSPTIETHSGEVTENETTQDAVLNKSQSEALVLN